MTTTVERRFIAGIVAFFVLAFVAVLWMIVGQVTTQYRLACDRAAAECALTRRHLVGEEHYRVRIPAEARAEVRVTPRTSHSAPRTFLEIVSASDRTFLIEYQGGAAESDASAAARRLNAFLAGETGPAIEEVAGSDRSARGTLAFVIAVALAGVVGWRVRRTRDG